VAETPGPGAFFFVIKLFYNKIRRMSSTILEEKHGTCIDLWFYETAARKRGAAFLWDKEKDAGKGACSIRMR
jgi:hypothetical protein